VNRLLHALTVVGHHTCRLILAVGVLYTSRVIISHAVGILYTLLKRIILVSMVNTLAPLNALVSADLAMRVIVIFASMVIVVKECVLSQLVVEANVVAMAFW